MLVVYNDVIEKMELYIVYMWELSEDGFMWIFYLWKDVYFYNEIVLIFKDV